MVTRLRLSFAAIAIVISAAATIGIQQLGNLQNSVTNLTTSSVEVFIKSEETERSLTSLILLFPQVYDAQTRDDLTRISGEMNEKITRLRGQLAALGQINQMGSVSDRLMSSVATLERLATSIFSTKANLIEHARNLDIYEAELRSSRDSIRASLEDINLNRQGLEQSRINTTTASGSGLSDLERRYSRELLLSTAMTSISLELEAILDKSLGLRNIEDRNTLSQVADDIRFKFRSVTTQLTRIENDLAQQQLATRISNIRDQVFGENGLVSEVANLLSDQEEMDALILRQYAPVREISELSSQLIQDARVDVDAANTSVDQNISQLALLMAMSEVTVLIVILSTIFIVVERQINNRMSKLTSAVLTIASGKNDYDVNVSGSDEIGRMASSLEVFKSNAAELARSNAELKTFAYVAAHDLRSPLRAIHNLAEWIVEDKENKLTEESSEYLRLLTNRIERLNRLLTDLLNYSLVGTQDESYGEVQIEDMVDEISSMLDPKSAFNITYSGSVKTVKTVALPLRQILQNLINNGIKHHDHPTGNIGVESLTHNQRIYFKVKDDGPGIEVQYQDKIFDLFRTLKPKDEVEASGLGLAIIRKIVDHYGGRVQTFSDPEIRRGTTFQFDLPLQEDISALTVSVA